MTPDDSARTNDAFATSAAVFVTTSTPFSDRAEIFVLDELNALRQISTSFWVVPARRRNSVAEHSAVDSGLIGRVVSPAVFSIDIARGALRTVRRHPLTACRQLWGILRNPKALWLAEFVRSSKARHIHAYWMSHTATMAMVASEISGVSWSATGYRWDLDSANHMRAKFSTAAFLRCADELGLADMNRLRREHDADTHIELIRTGVKIGESENWSSIPVDNNRFVCAGAFVPKKQQELLVRAFALHLVHHPTAVLEFIGDGPLRQRVGDVVNELGIGHSVTFRGTLALDQLRTTLRERPISVLPVSSPKTPNKKGSPSF